MTATFLLTGATGFVGRQVLRALNAEGIKVRAVVREGKQAQVLNFCEIETVVTTTDLFGETTAWWIDVCKDIDTVIHVAWYAEPGKYLQSPKNMDCLTGTLHLAKGAAQAGVRRFIGIGTCFEYDFSKGPLSIETPLNPKTLYAGTKAAAFLTLSQYLPQQGVEFGWFRLFYLYGEGEDSRRFVPYLRNCLMNGKNAELTHGNQIRDFLDVCEAGKIIAEMAISKKQGPLNICSGIPTSIKNLAEKIADEYGRRDLLKFGFRQENITDPPFIVGEK